MATEFWRMENLTSVSLFSGAGGLDVGFEDAGFRTLFANEVDHDAAQTWRVNRPGHEDIMAECDLNKCIGALSAFRDVDVVFGGPPCQGFSVAGKMDPLDKRSGLVFRFLDVVSKVRPKVFVMENVAALGALGKWHSVREEIIARSASSGYEISFKIHHTYDYGVPENRDRVIFVGVRKDISQRGHFQSFYDNLSRHRMKPPTAREIIISAGKYSTADNPQTCTARITLASHPVLRVSPYAGMLVNGAGRPINLDGIAPTLPASMGGNKTPIVDEVALHDPSVDNWFKTYHNALMSGKLSPLAAKVPDTLRRLTLKESALIQTFPAGYKFTGRKTKQYRQVGNAVPCLFANAIARSVRETYFAS